MKNIKTLEGFNLFKNKKEQPVSIIKYEDQIDLFLDDLKCITYKSYGYYKQIANINSIVYCFYIKNYNKKKYEIDIFLEEIESACKSIDIKFKYNLNKCKKLENHHPMSPISRINNLNGERTPIHTVDFIVLSFFTKNIPSEQEIYNALICGCYNLGMKMLDLNIKS